MFATTVDLATNRTHSHTHAKTRVHTYLHIIISNIRIQKLLLAIAILHTLPGSISSKSVRIRYVIPISSEFVDNRTHALHKKTLFLHFTTECPFFKVLFVLPANGVRLLDYWTNWRAEYIQTEFPPIEQTRWENLDRIQDRMSGT